MTAGLVNIINHEAAYCLYPHATLDLRLMVRLPFKRGLHPYSTNIYRKYQLRGYTFDHFWSPTDVASNPAVMPLGLRHIDDGLSFCVPWEEQPVLPASTIGLHQWNIGFEKNSYCLSILCNLCRSGRLKHCYILCGDLSVFQELFETVVTSNPEEQYVVIHHTFLVKLFLITGNRYLDAQFLRLARE